MAKTMLRFGVPTIRIENIFNSICQQINISNLKLLANNGCIKTISRRDISTNRFSLKELKPNEKFVDKHGNLIKKKHKDSQRIAVINLDGSRTSMFSREAQKIAKDQRLELVEVGVVADKKLYKFSDLLESEHESIETKKSTKLKQIIINSTIVDHDLMTKINGINKLLKKKNEVLVEIFKKSAEGSNVEKIIKKIRDEIGDDYKFVTISAKTKCRLKICFKNSDEKESNTDKSVKENELKSKTNNDSEESMSGKPS